MQTRLIQVKHQQDTNQPQPLNKCTAKGQPGPQPVTREFRLPMPSASPQVRARSWPGWMFMAEPCPYRDLRQTSLKGLSWARNIPVLRTLVQVPFTPTVLILNQEENNLTCTTAEAILLFTTPQKWAAFLSQHCLYFRRLLSAKQYSYLEQ